MTLPPKPQPRRPPSQKSSGYLNSIHNNFETVSQGRVSPSLSASVDALRSTAQPFGDTPEQTQGNPPIDIGDIELTDIFSLSNAERKSLLAKYQSDRKLSVKAYNTAENNLLQEFVIAKWTTLATHSVLPVVSSILNPPHAHPMPSSTQAPHARITNSNAPPPDHLVSKPARIGGRFTDLLGFSGPSQPSGIPLQVHDAPAPSVPHESCMPPTQDPLLLSGYESALQQKRKEMDTWVKHGGDQFVVRTLLHYPGMEAYSTELPISETCSP